MNRVMFFVVLGFFHLSTLSKSAIAADRPRLEVGLPMSEVLARWGKPIERIEKESRRQEVWVYPNGEVIFREGAVIAVPGGAGELVRSKPAAPDLQSSGRHAAPPLPHVETPGEADKKSVTGTSSATDVMGEVLRALPAGDSEKPTGRRLGTGAGNRLNRGVPISPIAPLGADDNNGESP